MNLPKRYLALFLLLATVPLATWAVAYQPINRAVANTAEEIRVQASRLATFPEIRDQHMEMRHMLGSLREASQVAFERIPETHNADEWLEAASRAAENFGLTVKSVTTSGTREEGSYSILPVDLSVSGSFEGVYGMIQSLEQLDRLGRVEQMTINRHGENLVDARFIIHLLFLSRGVQSYE